MQKDEEQDHIQVIFDVVRAKSAIDDLEGRLESLRSLGKIKDKDYKELSDLLKTLRGKIEKIGKK